jgi:thiol-disulfide isomerase/thioredoxin
MSNKKRRTAASTKRTSSRSRPQRTNQASRSTKAAKGSGNRIWWFIGGGIVIALIVAIVLSLGSEDSDGDGGVTQFGTPSVAGDSLADHDPEATDPEVGATAPTATGADFTGTPVSIEHDGRPKALLFVAHWCPVCQDELPEVQDLVDAGAVPDGVDVIAVATGTNATATNYPPSSWFTREGWTEPVLVDDAGGSVARAYGLTRYPFWVFLEGDGTVVARVAGLLPTETITQVLDSLAS